MSMGTIAGMGAVGMGSMAGLDAAAQVSALPLTTPSRTTPISELASSTAVNISSAARDTLAKNGLQPEAGMGELIQALIIAIMLQMLQGVQIK
ncbi:MAG: hypothetical protein WCJ76_15145 [Comamonadaceae bacterium]